MSLRTYTPAHLTGVDAAPRRSAAGPRPLSGAAVRSPKGLSSGAQAVLGLLDATSWLCGQRTEPVKVQLVGGDLAGVAAGWKLGWGGGGDGRAQKPMPGARDGRVAGQRRARDGCCMGTGFHHPTERTWGRGRACAVCLCGVCHPVLGCFTQHACGRSPSATSRQDRPILALSTARKGRHREGTRLPGVTQRTGLHSQPAPI